MTQISMQIPPNLVIQNPKGEAWRGVHLRSCYSKSENFWNLATSNLHSFCG